MHFRIELIAETKKKYPSTIIIMMTNYSTDQYRDKCIEEGADYFFDKSDLDKMLLLIKRLSEEE